MKILPKVLIAFLLIYISFLSINAQKFEKFRYWENETGLPHSYWIFENTPQSEITEIKKRWDEIGESLKTTSNPFAGTYSQAGNRGYYLRWSPEKGFVYVYYYEYFVRDASYGKVLVTDSEIKFIVEREMQNKDVNTKLITPVTWIPAYNEQQFLIRKEDIKLFGDFYGGFGDFNGFPLKWNCDCDAFAQKFNKDSNPAKIKSFIVPKKYLKFIKLPINAQIIYVGKRRISNHPLVFNIDLSNKASITPVTINIGQKSKIRRGLLFNIGEKDSVLEIIKVGDKTSRAIIVRGIDDNGKEAYSDGWDESTNKEIFKPYSPIRIGTKITTSSIDSIQ